MKTSKKIIKTLRHELDKNFKSLHTTDDIKNWYKKIIKGSKIKIKIIPLNKCKNLSKKDINIIFFPLKAQTSYFSDLTLGGLQGDLGNIYFTFCELFFIQIWKYA